MGRIQSPSSINTFNQCPRKYYYQYIEKLETKPNIHLVRGNVMHSVLENFFKTDISRLSDNFEVELRTIAHELLRKFWNEKKDKFDSLDLEDEQIDFFYSDSETMLNNWMDNFVAKLGKQENFTDGFKKLTPNTEVHYLSDNHQVQGYIDAIHESPEEVVLIDYKTSKKDYMSSEYKLQLAIYALLYYEKHGVLPSKVGVDFLKFNEKMIEVDESMVEYAKEEVSKVHRNTKSQAKEDYSKNPTPLCNWCDFYELCFGKKLK